MQIFCSLRDYYSKFDNTHYLKKCHLIIPTYTFSRKTHEISKYFTVFKTKMYFIITQELFLFSYAL